MSATLRRKMSLAQATMLVAGNMIGTGIFLLPVNLAQVGSISIYGWLIATAGAAGAWPGVRAARPGESAAGRTLCLCARLPRPVRGLPDQLHLLVRQLGGQHRDCGSRGGLSRRADPPYRCAAGQHHRHGADHLAADLRQHHGAARGGRARGLDHGAGADPHRGHRAGRLVLVRSADLQRPAGMSAAAPTGTPSRAPAPWCCGPTWVSRARPCRPASSKTPAATCRWPPSSAWCSPPWCTC